MNFENIEWGVFEVGKLFLIENCKCSNVSLLEDGIVPYVGATNRNNGTMRFVKSIPQLITKGNCIAFICDGEGSIGFSIYKKEDFIGSTTVKVGRNKHLNIYNATFITTIADTVRSKYNFGFKRNETHLKKERILLPTDSKGEPDFIFMEEFMKKKEMEQLNQYYNYIDKRILKISEYKNIKSLSDKEWKEFFLNDIFKEIQRGKRLKKADHIQGQTPYISSTALNNGISGFIGNINNVRIFQNCLTVANSGSVGSTFFQPFAIIASDHVTKLKNENFNKYLYLFISMVVSKISEKYSFNREINDARIQREKILLPVDKKGNPDYIYMENYMKKIELEKLSQYIKFKKSSASM